MNARRPGFSAFAHNPLLAPTLQLPRSLPEHLPSFHSDIDRQEHPFLLTIICMSTWTIVRMMLVEFSPSSLDLTRMIDTDGRMQRERGALSSLWKIAETSVRPREGVA